jgi:hypothetical protein
MFCPEPLLIREPELPGYKEYCISYPQWKRDSVVLGRMFCPEPLLIREPDYLATRRKFTLKGKGILWFLEGCSALSLT